MPEEIVCSWCGETVSASLVRKIGSSPENLYMDGAGRAHYGRKVKVEEPAVEEPAPVEVLPIEPMSLDEMLGPIEPPPAPKPKSKKKKSKGIELDWTDYSRKKLADFVPKQPVEVKS
jgi:hypothetical protein